MPPFTRREFVVTSLAVGFAAAFGFGGLYDLRYVAAQTGGVSSMWTDAAPVLARITGILAEHSISIDALLQRESAEGEAQTDVIILTHDTVEREMNQAIAQMQALPTVLAPIVKIRKEELA